MTEFVPALRKYPDGVRARYRIVDPGLLPYLALLLGSAVAGVVAAVTLVQLSRVRKAILCVILGLAGIILFNGVIGVLWDAGVRNRGVLLLAGRAVHVGVGAVLPVFLRRHVRGHRHLGGDEFPLLPVYLIAFVIMLMLPWRYLLLLLGGVVGS